MHGKGRLSISWLGNHTKKQWRVLIYSIVSLETHLEFLCVITQPRPRKWAISAYKYAKLCHPEILLLKMFWSFCCISLWCPQISKMFIKVLHCYVENGENCMVAEWFSIHFVQIILCNSVCWKDFILS